MTSWRRRSKRSGRRHRRRFGPTRGNGCGGMAEGPRGFGARSASSYPLGQRPRTGRSRQRRKTSSVASGGLRLRGSIDSIERDQDGFGARDRPQDRARRGANHGVVVGGGADLQPVLYGLAAEKLLAKRVEGRPWLYYCTSTGRLRRLRCRAIPSCKTATERRPIRPLRDVAGEVVNIIGGAREKCFFPAAPDQGECNLVRLSDGVRAARRTCVQRKNASPPRASSRGSATGRTGEMP